MHKNHIQLIIFFLIISCKTKTLNTISNSSQKKIDYSTQKKIYDGKGTFDKNGIVHYKAFLPSEVNGKISVVQQFKIDDKNLFIQINTPGNDDLLQKPNPIDLEIPINKINPKEFQEKISVYLWHDAILVKDIDEAKEIMLNKCANNFAPPERCGNGVLTKE